MPLILCARVSWPVPAVRVADYSLSGVFRGIVRQCSRCGARVKVVA